MLWSGTWRTGSRRARLATLEADAALLNEARLPADHPNNAIGGERTDGLDG